MIQLQCIYFGLFSIVVLILQDCDGAAVPPYACYERNDVTLKDCANGSVVVEAVLAKFNCLQVFGHNHIFMKRIAFVESEFGESICGSGGIWRLKEELFH